MKHQEQISSSLRLLNGFDKQTSVFPSLTLKSVMKCTNKRMFIRLTYSTPLHALPQLEIAEDILSQQTRQYWSGDVTLANLKRRGEISLQLPGLM